MIVRNESNQTFSVPLGKDTIKLNYQDCNSTVDCKWYSGLPEKYGGCGCFNQSILDKELSKRNYDLQRAIIKYCEPPPNVNEPCLCQKNKCGVNLKVEEKKLDCKALEFKTNELLKDLKSCSKDSDCFLDNSINLGCPFGCFLVRSRMYDDGLNLTLLKKMLDQYKQQCVLCKYSCFFPMSKDNVRCVDRQCVYNSLSLENIEFRDVISDLNESIKNNDFRFVGIYGYTIEIPSIDDGKWEKELKKYGYKMIEGTSDVIDDIRLYKIARKYAREYNQGLLEKVKDR